MRILAVGAHFDDVELGCGGAIARHADAGDEVTLFVATNSGFTNYAQEVIRRPEVALEEGREAARILGIKDLICGEFPTNSLEFNDALTCALIKIIEERKIEAIYTHWDGDVHHDHHVVAQATLAASRHIPRLLMYRSNYYDGSKSFEGRFYVDVSRTIERKKESIRAHASEYDRVGEKWLRFFLNQNENDGRRIGVAYAECFQAVKYLI